jgi:hypothetical protein
MVVLSLQERMWEPARRQHFGGSGLGGRNPARRKNRLRVLDEIF